MATELVLLCDREPASQVIDAAGADLFPGGDLWEYPDGQVRQYRDAQGRAVLTVFAARAIRTAVDADRAVRGGAGGFSCWVTLTVPYGDEADGRALADAVASAVGGRVVERC